MRFGKGWRDEPLRHSLARKGVSTGRKSYAGSGGKQSINTPSEMDKQAYHAEIEKYQGWTNRETWAVKLHWDNNEGDYNYLTEQAKEFKKAGKKEYEFGDFLKDYADEIEESVIEGNATREAKLFMQDVGSLWRVNWNEIAETYYDEE